MNNVLIVANIDAGRRQAVRYKKHVINFVLKYTKTFKLINCNELPFIDTKPFDTIIVMGGDGTVNKALPYIINTEKTLGIIPCGTANLLSAKLGIPENVQKALKVIERGNIEKIDVMNIGGEYSVLRCGIGYDSDIICKTKQSLKNKFGYFAYFVAGIIFALRLKAKEYKLTIDEQEYNISASCIIFANAANMYKKFISLSANSSIDDGLIDIFILKTENPIEFVLEVIKIIFNVKKDSKTAEYLKARNVVMDDVIAICHIDGEKKILKDKININMQNKALNIYSNR